MKTKINEITGKREKVYTITISESILNQIESAVQTVDDIIMEDPSVAVRSLRLEIATLVGRVNVLIRYIKTLNERQSNNQ